MKIKNWLVLAAIFIFYFSQYAISEEAKPAPDFTLRDLNQNTFTLSNYKNEQSVLLFFWTTWCPFCREELKFLKSAYPELTKEGLVLVAINAGESAAKVNNFAKSYNFPFRILLDTDISVAGAFGIFGVPTYVLADKKGYVRLIEHSFPKEKYKSIISE
jgi:peroxiredoxin